MNLTKEKKEEKCSALIYLQKQTQFGLNEYGHQPLLLMSALSHLAVLFVLHASQKRENNAGDGALCVRAGEGRKDPER